MSRCDRCGGNGYTIENRASIASSMGDGEGDVIYAGECILCGHHVCIDETPEMNVNAAKLFAPMRFKKNVEQDVVRGLVLDNLARISNLRALNWHFRDIITYLKFPFHHTTLRKHYTALMLGQATMGKRGRKKGCTNLKTREAV